MRFRMIRLKLMPVLVVILSLTSIGLGSVLGLAYGQIRALKQELAAKDAALQQEQQDARAVLEFFQQQVLGSARP